jgi:predicted MFS family arabinose efflux permease
MAIPGVLPTLLTTTVWAMGAYTVYTYVSPFLAYAAGLSPERAGLVLTLLGIGAIGGVTLGGHASDRFGTRRVQAIALPVTAAAFAGLSLAAGIWAPHALAAILPLVLLWGFSAWGFFPPQQARLVSVSGIAHAPIALSLNASFMYVGFSLGAATGSMVIAASSVAFIGVAGAASMLGAILLSRFAWATHSRHASSTQRNLP